MLTTAKRRATPVLLLALFSLAGTPAFADATLFYGGDPNGSSAAYNMDLVSPYPPPYNYEIADRVYDNFVVPTGQTWTINDIFAVISNPGGAFSNASYEIRTGLDNGTGGTLVASGSLPAIITPLSGVPTVNGLPSERLDVDLTSPVVLHGGTTYWVSLVPVAYDSFNRFIGFGTGNAVDPPATPQAYLYDYRTGNPFNNDPGSYQSLTADYSLGVAGTDSTATPEPATVVSAGIAGVICAGYGWYRRRRGRKA